MIASLIADDARASMLLALYTEGAALSTSALAARARIGLPAASAHLARLRRRDWWAASARGAPDCIGRLDPTWPTPSKPLAPSLPIRPTRTLNESSQLAALRTARTCYDHLAGRLGVGYSLRSLPRRLCWS